MARPLRLEFPGALWHVTSRGNAQQPVFLDDEDRIKFLDYLRRAVDRFGWLLHAYVLMTNHYLCAAPHKKCYGERPVMWSWRDRGCEEQRGMNIRCA